MEYPLSILPEESEFSIDSEDEQDKKPDPFQSSIPTWTTRYQCLQAYCCYVFSYLSTLKFCLTVGRYGYVILIPYWVYNILVGFGAVLVEVQLGRYVIGNVSRAWNMCPLSRGILWCAFGTTFFTIIYDHMSNAYLLQYFFWSFGKEIPWSRCNPEWCHINCYEFGKEAKAIARCMKIYSEAYCRNLTLELPAVQFWKYRIKGRDSQSIGGSVACLAVSVILSFFVNYKGIRSVEKLFPLFVYLTVGLWVLLGCMTFLIPGAIRGLSELWSFQWSYLFQAEMWLDGLRDTVYILGLSKLTLSFISSHGRFDDNILMDVLIASIGGIFACAVITTPILSIIASLKKKEGFAKGGPIFDNIDEIFIFMSEALTFYPFPTPMWSVVSYLTWLLMSASAQALSVLAICEAIQGLLHKKPNFFFWISSIVAVSSFCVGVIFLFFPILFRINLGTTTIMIILMNTLTWQHGYGIWKFNKDYYFMMGRPIPTFLKGTWISMTVVPIVNITAQLIVGWPKKPFNGVVYIYVTVPVTIYLASMIFRIIEFSSEKKKIVQVFQANPDWGPQNPLLRKSRIHFDSTTASIEMLYRQELCNRPYIKPPEFANQNIVHLI